jgi:hypothetical protein
LESTRCDRREALVTAIAITIEVASEDAITRAWRRAMEAQRRALLADAAAHDAEAEAYELEVMLVTDPKTRERLERYARTDRELAEHYRAMARGDRGDG